MDMTSYNAVNRAIQSEVQRLLEAKPPRTVGVELWGILKMLNANPGPATLQDVYHRAAGLNPLRLPEELKEGILRIMVAARYHVDFRSRQPERDRS